MKSICYRANFLLPQAACPSEMHPSLGGNFLVQQRYQTTTRKLLRQPQSQSPVLHDPARKRDLPNAGSGGKISGQLCQSLNQSPDGNDAQYARS